MKRNFCAPPLKDFTQGIKVDQANVVFKVNFVAVVSTGRSKNNQVNLNNKEVNQLAEEINAKVTLSGGIFELKDISGCSGVLVMRGIRFNFGSKLKNERKQTLLILKEFIRKSNKVLRNSLVNKKRVNKGQPMIKLVLFSDI
ncbi:MAG: hypothetical protein HZC15_01030 [Candidatus Omnitrophica bacterium]|nr:hypothetical protein [Candidatus Omnitrophota bacterium]